MCHRYAWFWAACNVSITSRMVPTAVVSPTKNHCCTICAEAMRCDDGGILMVEFILKSPLAKRERALMAWWLTICINWLVGWVGG